MKKFKLKAATTGRWQTETPNVSNFPRGRALAEVFAEEEARKDATHDFLAELLKTDRPDRRSVSLPEGWPCETYEEDKPTKMIFPVGPEKQWTLDLNTRRGNCGLWLAMIQLSVPLVSREKSTLKSVYDVTVNGAPTQTKAIEAVVAAGRIAGFIAS